MSSLWLWKCRCICTLLVGKTRILVTHQLQFLPEADMIVVLRSGQITNVGTYDELVGMGIDFHEFELKKGNGSQDGDDGTDTLSSSESDPGMLDSSSVLLSK